MSLRLPFAFLLFAATLHGEEPKQRTVEELAKSLKPSIVVVTSAGREASRTLLGTGYIVSADGLIATNFHVIGEGRPLAVETADGKKFDVLSIEATDRARDLALIKIDAKNLPALELGDSDDLKDGQPIVVLGNPQGLKHSVVSGVVSGRREIEGMPMIQLAIPLEPGNSGGPLVDMQGRVQGTITLKSLVTENLGYASPVNAIKPLIAKPNPVLMSAWVTIGALDPDEWKPLMGSSWKQRAGRIKVQGAGSGFGGRSVCINQAKPPALPYEVSVTVKLDDEKGAAGLIFHHADDRHYGFYPTGGKLRLTRFDGPDVFSWKILEDVPSPHYRPGDWNTLKVRVSKDGIKAYVNDQLAIESDDTALTTGLPGLAKFRDTAAEFKNFQVAKSITPIVIPDADIAKLLKPFDNLSSKTPVPDDAIELLAKAKSSGDVLRDRARELEKQATRLREVADHVHQWRVFEELTALLKKPEDKIDLIHAALLLAKLDNEEVDVAAYRAEFERTAAKLKSRLPAKADDKVKLALLNRYFFDERGFHGSRDDYYSRSNSYLNEVLDDREGLPITLSVVYMELAGRIGLKLSGIGMPGHFVTRHGEGDFIDVFERGKTFTLDEAKKRIESRGFDFRDDHVAPIAKKAIITRMLHNLLRVAREDSDMTAGLRYLDGIVLLDPDSHEERFMRSMIRAGKGMKKEALEDVDFLLGHFEEGPQRKRLVELKRMIERKE